MLWLSQILSDGLQNIWSRYFNESLCVWQLLFVFICCGGSCVTETLNQAHNKIVRCLDDPTVELQVSGHLVGLLKKKHIRRL